MKLASRKKKYGEPCVEYRREGDRWRALIHLKGKTYDGGLSDCIPPLLRETTSQVEPLNLESGRPTSGYEDYVE